MEEPEILGIAALVPAQSEETYEKPDESGEVSAQDPDLDMSSNDEVEAVGMRVARNYEEERGWKVEDVSDKDHGGFDLRSMRFSEDDGSFEALRHIEVKARSRSGKIRLTANEWKMARKFGEEYWLYIVTQAGTDDPELTRIQNPAERFEEGQDIRATGFEIQEDAWRSRTGDRE